jgi:hypothetical protein
VGGETTLSLAVYKWISQLRALDVVCFLLMINAPVESVPGTSFVVSSRLEEAVSNAWSMLDLAVHKSNTQVGSVS